MTASTFRIVVATLAVLLATATAQAKLGFVLSSPLGQTGDSVRGVVIQSDGTVVLAANSGGSAAIVRIDPADGQIKSQKTFGGSVHDLDIDAADNLYVAAGDNGIIKLAPSGTQVLSQASLNGHVERIAASPDGHVAALRVSTVDDSKPGRGEISVFSPRGQLLSRFTGHRNTLDVAIDQKSKTVIHVGWRQGHTAGNPVQIAYLRGVGFDGQQKWLGYDWSEDENSDRYLNRSENNMADTRGYRVSIGDDGKLYAAYEAAGGNHIFRYSPFDIMAKASLAGGDRYHNFSNSRSEHKTVVVKYEPETGEPMTGQEFAGRTDSGRTNAVRVKEGAVEVDAKGRLLIGGASASGLPMTIDPPGTGDYTGGAYLWMMSDDLNSRLFCTRVQSGGTTHAVAARFARGKLIVAMAGSTSDKPDNMLFTHKPMQEETAPSSGFFTILSMDDTPPPGYRPGPRIVSPSDSEPAATPKPTPQPPTETAAERNERIATVRLSAARSYLDADKPRDARPILEQIVERWPDTEAANTAQQLLDEIID